MVNVVTKVLIVKGRDQKKGSFIHLFEIERQQLHVHTEWNGCFKTMQVISLES